MNNQTSRKMVKSLSVAMMLGLGVATTSTTALALELDNNNRLGDAGLFQYYTANGDWQTFIRVVNTSDDVVAVKIRFREAANSREVLDYIVFLSPHDVWAGWTDADALGNGIAGVRTTDTSCLYPLPDNNNTGEGWKTISGALKGAEFQDRAFTGDYDDGADLDSATRVGEGHIEVIGIGRYPNNFNFGNAVTHSSDTGKPESCSTAANLYETTGGALEGLNTGAWASDLGNVLAMNGYLVNVPMGMGGGFDPDILRDFWSCSARRCPSGASLQVASLDTATDPDLDSAFNRDLANNGLNDNREKQKGFAGIQSVSGGVDQVSYELMRASVINEWAASANPAAIVSDYYTQWVVGFPTKHYYVDLQNDPDIDEDGRDDISPTLVDLNPSSSNNDAYRPFSEEFDFLGDGKSCELYQMYVWNREERFSTFASPAPVFPVDLCYETNVIVFNEFYETAGLQSNFAVTIPAGRLPTDVVPGGPSVTSERGWAEIDFTAHNYNWRSLEQSDDDENTNHRHGLPVNGFMLSVYNTNDTLTNHSAINSHAYRIDEDEGCRPNGCSVSAPAAE